MDLPSILKDKTFKMSDMLVPWMYEIKSVTGEKHLHYFECLEAIKLEL